MDFGNFTDTKAISQVFGDFKCLNTLEIYKVFWFENILVSQMISAIIHNCFFIAVIESFGNLAITYSNIIFDNVEFSCKIHWIFGQTDCIRQ